MDLGSRSTGISGHTPCGKEVSSEGCQEKGGGRFQRKGQESAGRWREGGKDSRERELFP